MPGIRYAGTRGGAVGVPPTAPYLLGKSQTIYAGDVVCLTTNATYSASTIPVQRDLLAADVSANYQQGGSNVGVLGFCMDDVIVNSNYQATTGPAFGGVANGSQVIYPYTYDGLIAVDPNTTRGYGRVCLFDQENIYAAKLSAASAAGTLALVNTLAAFLLTTSGGITTYTIDTTGASTNILRIVGVNTSDPLYGAVGCEVFFQILGAYEQSLTGLQYTSQ